MSTDVHRNEFIENLYHEYYADLKRYAYHYFRNDSKFTPYIEDCIQETFAKAVQGDGGWNTPDMVTKRYAHILDEDRKNLAAEMEASFYQDSSKTSTAALTPAKTETAPVQAAAPAIDVNALAALLAKDTSLLVKVLQSVQLANNP